MGEPLKNQFDGTVPRAMAEQLSRAWAEFEPGRFLADVMQEYDELELMDRGRAIAIALGRHLPPAYPQALDVLMRSIREPHSGHNLRGGMAAFYYLPHTSFIASSGLDHFDLSMRAQRELTQLFSAEFSIRPFIERFEKESLDVLRAWASDPNDHVRRLVSEGTRPRLPWGSRLRSFQRNPKPVIALLELLKDDESLYVRRSVANNLNDIGKDHPDILIRTATRWMKGASEERRALVRHSLRSLVKQGNAKALAILGFEDKVAVTVENASVTPRRVAKGGRVTVAFTIRSRSRERQKILVDFRIFFVKANGAASPKVFKLRSVELGAREAASFRKSVTLADLTTRKHYPGVHAVDVLVNGSARPIGSFKLAGKRKKGTS